jgi:hypothetical protein
MAAALAECATYHPAVCTTPLAAGWKIRRRRLMDIVPLRQFLDREGVKVSAKEIDAEIERMKKLPSPLGATPPRPLRAVMVRDCITWNDLRPMIRVDIGMKRWAETRWRKTWPTDVAWEEHCRREGRALRNRIARFRRLSFGLSPGPKGAADEDEAMSILKRRAADAARKLAAGTPLDAVAKDANVQGTVAAEILPFDVFGPDRAHELRSLPLGKATSPISTRFGWHILLKEPLSASDRERELKSRFSSRTLAATVDEIVSGSKVEKVKCMAAEQLEPDGGVELPATRPNPSPIPRPGTAVNNHGSLTTMIRHWSPAPESTPPPPASRGRPLRWSFRRRRSSAGRTRARSASLLRGRGLASPGSILSA